MCNTFGTEWYHGLPVQSGVKNSLPWNFPSIFERKFSYQPIISLMSGLRQVELKPGQLRLIFDLYVVHVLCTIVLPDLRDTLRSRPISLAPETFKKQHVSNNTVKCRHAGKFMEHFILD